MSGRGRSSFRPRRGFRGRGGGGYSDFPSSIRYDGMQRKSRDYDSSYDGHKQEMEMTRSVSSGLHGENQSGSRPTGYKQHSRNYQSEDFEHDRKKYYKDSERSMREPHRNQSESRRYSKDHREEHYSRPSIISKDSHKYIERKRSYDDDYLDHSMKRQRLGSEGGSFRGSKFPMHRESKFPMDRDSKYTHRESRPPFKPFQRFPSKTYFPRGRGQHKPDFQRYSIKATGRLKFNSERMLPFPSDRSSSRDRAAHMKGALKPSGRRRIEGTPYHGHGGEHVQLKCPHCPSYEAITFKEYRFHLDTPSHSHNLGKLVRKHSSVLRKIRLQQRDEQRGVEEAASKDNPEKLRETEKEFCSVCKLHFRLFSSESQEEHKRCRFHKMQIQYLRPFCKLCKMNLPSLMVYENHVASIRHLRSICEKKSMKKDISDEGDVVNSLRDDAEEFDLSNFVTMDAVGEDDVASVSDNEEITGKLEEVEEAMKETKANYDNDSVLDNPALSDCDLKGSPMNDFSLDNSSPQRSSNADNSSPRHEESRYKESEVMDGEDALDKSEDCNLLVEDYRSDDEQSLVRESVGTEYLCEIEAMLCRLCGVAVRTDCLGAEAIDKHCRSVDHINRYDALNERRNNDKVEDSDNETVDSQDDKEHCSSRNSMVKSPCPSGDEDEETAE